MQTNPYLDALDTLVDSRPMLDWRNYGDVASYRADQRANARDRADYWLLRRIGGTPSAEAIEAAARGSRLSSETRDDGAVSVYYCAGQYYPREYRAAACRLLASLWWHAQHASMSTPYNADDIRAQARRVFGRGLARRWFS